jgi:hypothetical protein
MVTMAALLKSVSSDYNIDECPVSFGPFWGQGWLHYSLVPTLGRRVVTCFKCSLWKGVVHHVHALPQKPGDKWYQVAAVESWDKRGCAPCSCRHEVWVQEWLHHTSRSQLWCLGPRVVTPVDRNCEVWVQERLHHWITTVKSGSKNG